MDLRFKSESDVELIDSMGDDARIAMAAWVVKSIREGLERERIKPGSVAGVINYMMKHRHGTPFEATCIQTCMTTPIFVWREHHRHRIGFSYNEESARYKVLEPVFFIPDRTRPMIKVDDWKPGRPKFLTLDEAAKSPDGLKGPAGKEYHDDADAFYRDMVDDMKWGYQDDYARYERQLARELDPGLARDNLPVGIFSSCWVTCNARSMMAFLSLRTHEPTSTFVSYPLAEIDAVARKVEAIFQSLFPITHAAFCANGRVGP